MTDANSLNMKNWKRVVFKNKDDTVIVREAIAWIQKNASRVAELEASTPIYPDENGEFILEIRYFIPEFKRA